MVMVKQYFHHFLQPIGFQESVKDTFCYALTKPIQFSPLRFVRHQITQSTHVYSPNRQVPLSPFALFFFFFQLRANARSPTNPHHDVSFPDWWVCVIGITLLYCGPKRQNAWGGQGGTGICHRVWTVATWVRQIQKNQSDGMIITSLPRGLRCGVRPHER